MPDAQTPRSRRHLLAEGASGRTTKKVRAHINHERDTYPPCHHPVSDVNAIHWVTIRTPQSTVANTGVLNTRSCLVFPVLWAGANSAHLTQHGFPAPSYSTLQGGNSPCGVIGQATRIFSAFSTATTLAGHADISGNTNQCRHGHGFPEHGRALNSGRSWGFSEQTVCQ